MTSVDGALIRVQIQLDRALLDAIDGARGDVSRSMFIRRRLEQSILAGPDVVRAEDEPVFTGGLVSKLDVQFGPTRAAPGAGLKKGKDR